MCIDCVLWHKYTHIGILNVSQFASTGVTTNASIEFTLFVYDLGTPALFDSAPVSINVVNNNLYAPVFDSPLYIVEIPENETAGYLLLTLTATDEDCGDSTGIVNTAYMSISI